MLLNRASILSVLVLVACAPRALSTGSRVQTPPMVGRVSDSDPAINRMNRIWWDAPVISDFVIRYSLERNNHVMAAFSTKAPPAWAKDKAAIDATYGSVSTLSKTLLRNSKEPWTFRVPANIVGKRYEDIGEEEIVLEMIDLPADAPYLGVMKNGSVKTEPETTSPPPPRP